jgi:beta-N-acetylhexosaminidase
MGLKINLVLLIFFTTLIICLFIIKQPNLNFYQPSNPFLLFSKKNNIETNLNKNFKEKLGQNLVVGIPNKIIDEKTEAILRYIKPAGIVLYARNYQSNLQFKELISQLQKISQEESGTCYFIMIDEEPNGATRLKLFQNVFYFNFPDWRTIEQGVEVLSKLGINVLLAPLADFPFNNDSFIKKRIPFDNYEDLISFNRTFINLLKKYNISATLKHFPGLGVFTKDPHDELPILSVQRDMFNQSLMIFKDGINNGADFVMTGHAIYENIDSKNLATFSSKIIKEILGRQLNFNGIIISDDLSEMILDIKGIDPAERGIKALKAGHNLIMYSHNLEKTKNIFDTIYINLNTDQELQSIIENNYQKIINFKKSSTCPNSKPNFTTKEDLM